MNGLDLLFAAGRPLSPLYAAAMRLRAQLYRKGILHQYRAVVPVVSVGNLTWGGTGKTPLVILLARFAREQGFKPAVVSRGYGGAAREPVNVVSDGESLQLQADQAGDEPRLLAESLPGVPVLTGHKRVNPVRHAVETLGADLILLDDGFQHLALERKLDIVLFRYDRPLGNGRVFPGGPLREPLAALARADCFVLTGRPAMDREPESHWFAQELQKRYPQRPVFFSSFAIDRILFARQNGMPVEPGNLAGKRVFAFCGLGNPDSFRTTLLHSGVELAGFKACRDHRRYVQGDVDQIVSACKEARCDKVVTTEKDYVKVRHLHWVVPLAVTQGRAVVDDSFFTFLRQRFASFR